jgi:hypothetical protein
MKELETTKSLNYAVYDKTGCVVDKTETRQEANDKYGKPGIAYYSESNHRVEFRGDHEYYCMLIPGSRESFRIAKKVAIEHFHVDPDTAVWVIEWDVIDWGHGIRLFGSETRAFEYVNTKRKNPNDIPRESFKIYFMNVH